jgi:hypothetical protein
MRNFGLRTLVVLGVIIFSCSIVSSQMLAEDLPRALANVDLGSAECITDTEAMNIRGEAWSPNGFPGGQCTWYADGRWKEYYGVKLNFSITSGRDAWKWWDIVTNTGKGNANFTGNYAGEIMVLNKWTGNPYGHVAFVESSKANASGGTQWYVTHANWSNSDAKVRTIEGYRITAKTFYRVSSSRVNTGGSAQYPLRGFLYKK